MMPLLTGISFEETFPALTLLALGLHRPRHGAAYCPNAEPEAVTSGEGKQSWLGRFIENGFLSRHENINPSRTQCPSLHRTGGKLPRLQRLTVDAANEEEQVFLRGRVGELCIDENPLGKWEGAYW